MNKESRLQLNRITKTVVRSFKPERVILFGSFASGKSTKGSDFDIFIVKDTTKRQIDRVREVRRLLPKNRGNGVDLIIYTPEELQRAIVEGNTFIKKILGEGEKLYG